MQTLKTAKNIFIYGTGTVGRDVWRVLSAKGFSLTGYMDHIIPENPFIGLIPIVLPDSVEDDKKGSAVIIIAIHNREVDMPTLLDHLKTLGYMHFISMIDLYDNFADELGIRYWLTRRTFYRDYETKINAAKTLWADKLSCDTYAKTLQFRISGDNSLLPEPDKEHQYFPRDLPTWHQPMRFIDCGAFEGDVIRDFTQNGFIFSALAAFEPDSQNYSRLVKYIQENETTISEVSLFPCGVSTISSQLGFASGRGEASSLVVSREKVVQCVALDEALPNFAPTLIKMDVEGAEMDALLGARRLISKFQPGLAISVYHTPYHIWEIPLWVAQFAKENGINYTYYLRSHAYNCFDTVFYAVPIS